MVASTRRYLIIGGQSINGTAMAVLVTGYFKINEICFHGFL